MAGGGCVGVIIAAWNAQHTVARAAQSALSEDAVGEVIVVDDGSTDGTAEAARKTDDGSGRLAVITRPQNRGPAAARNLALAHSRCPYVCILDADDYFLPGRIERLLSSAGAGWDLVADDILIIPERLAHRPPPLELLTATPATAVIDLPTFVRGNIPCSTKPRAELGFLKPIIRRDFLRHHGLAYDDTFRLGEDYVLYTRALLAGAQFKLTGALGYVAVERAHSVSGRHSAGDLGRIADFDTRCLITNPKLDRAARFAFLAHRTAMLNKLDYRAILDHKRDHGLLSALHTLAGAPRSWPYIAVETLRAKLSLLFHDTRHCSPAAGNGKARLLIGASLDFDR